jgi:epoxide hydrolase-like predicted phosphatase
VIKVYCFDLDGVVFAPTCFKDFKAKIADITVYPDKIDHVFHGEKMDLFKKGVVAENEFWVYANTELGLSMSIGDYMTLLSSCYKVQPQVRDIIMKLRSEGKRIALCTNNFVTRIQAAQAATQFLDMFDTQIFSYNIGALKPDVKIFQALIDQSGCEPAEIFYSDDNDDKLAGAKALGIKCMAIQNISELFVAIDKASAKA